MAINLINPSFNLINTAKTASTSQSSAIAGNASGSAAGNVPNFSEVLGNVMTNLQSTAAADKAASGTASTSDAAVGAVSGTVDLDAIFQKAADTYNVPLQLLKAVAKAESNFDPTSESGAGAQGIMQLMPGTAKSLGVTNAFDPEQNIMGGAKYLSQQLARYDGNEVLALAAYNAGPGNVAKYNGVPPFTETRNYISKVMAYAGEPISAGEAMLSNQVSAQASAQTSTQTSALNSDSILQQLSSGIFGTDLSNMDPKDYGLLMDLYRYKIQLNALTDYESDSNSGSNPFSSLTSLV